MSRFPAPLFALLLGALTVLGFAPFHLFPLPFVTLPFLLFQRAASPRRAAWIGFLWGLGFFLAGVSWVYVSMHDFGGMPAVVAALATLFFCAYLALFPALAGWLFSYLRSDILWRDTLLFAGAWTLAEWLRGWLLTGFPWLALGYSQAPPSPLAGYAPLLGVYGVGFVLTLIAALLAALLSKLSWRSVLLILFILIVGLVLQRLPWTQPEGQPLTVSLLQGNIPQSLKWEPERLPQSLGIYARLAHEHPAQLTVLPETALPLFFDQVPPDYLAAITAHGPALVGVAMRTREDGYINAAVAITAAAAAPATKPQVYVKSHLVPFGEYVPPGFSWFLALMKIPMSDFSAGPRVQAPLDLAGQRVAANICYEDLFGEEIIRALPAATLLVNLSNTAWFGDSLAQPQHLQIAQLRALETGRFMLRATNTGMTAAVGPDGVVAAALPAFSGDALTVEVQGYTGMTPYARWGNRLAVLIALLAFLPTLIRRRSRAAAVLSG